MYLFQRLEDPCTNMEHILNEINFLIKNEKYMGNNIYKIDLEELYEIIIDKLPVINITYIDGVITIKTRGGKYEITEQSIRNAYY